MFHANIQEKPVISPLKSCLLEHRTIVTFESITLTVAIGVKIDFTNVCKMDRISDDFKNAEFRTVLQAGNEISLKIEISNDAHELMPNVYNLAFGPMNSKGDIDDKAELRHRDYSKVFSTIVFNAFNYLSRNNSHHLGIDGSDNLRAWYYWRFLQRNYDYLGQHFEMFGLKYYVRITRFGKQQYENPFDFRDIQPWPDRIKKTTTWPKHMYNYFIFRLRQAV